MALAAYQMQLQRSNQRLAQFDGAIPKPVRQLEKECNEKLRQLVANEISSARPRKDSGQCFKPQRIENLLNVVKSRSSLFVDKGGGAFPPPIGFLD